MKIALCSRTEPSPYPPLKGHVFSAKGAALNQKAGQRPGFVKARFTTAHWIENARSFDSRFQRLCVLDQNSWGDAQAQTDIAPLALKTHSKRQRRLAEYIAVTISNFEITPQHVKMKK